MRFAVGIWAYGKTGDRFLLDGYRDDAALVERVRAASRNEDVSAIELNYPGDISAETAPEVGDMLRDAGLEAAMVGVDLSGDRRWRFGSLSSDSQEVREEAVDCCIRTAETARSIGCDRINLWLGQDGFDYCFQCDYPGAWTRLVEGVSRLAGEAPDLKICIEYKPKEPRTHSLIDSAAKALLLCREAGRKNVGVTVDVGHSFNAGENVAEAVCLLGDGLFHVHLNDNYRIWDDDLIVGSVHTIEYIELLYWLRRIGYEGYYSLDVFPYRENPERVVEESIEFLKSASAVIDRIGMDNIADSMRTDDVTAALSSIRKAVFRSAS